MRPQNSRSLFLRQASGVTAGLLWVALGEWQEDDWVGGLAGREASALQSKRRLSA